MGGAAHALALARLVMASALPVRLHLVIPIFENAVGSAAFRPGDVLTSRQGLTVEIGNTDAEGRLIRSDEHTAELKSLKRLSDDVFCWKKNKLNHNTKRTQ